MASLDRKALRALADAATTGPWDNDAETSVGAGDFWVAHIVEGDGNAVDDAKFIAAARTAVPALLDELDAKDTQITKLRATITRLVGLSNEQIDHVIAHP